MDYEGNDNGRSWSRFSFFPPAKLYEETILLCMFVCPPSRKHGWLRHYTTTTATTTSSKALAKLGDQEHCQYNVNKLRIHQFLASDPRLRAIRDILHLPEALFKVIKPTPNYRVTSHCSGHHMPPLPVFESDVLRICKLSYRIGAGEQSFRRQHILYVYVDRLAPTTYSRCLTVDHNTTIEPAMYVPFIIPKTF